MTDIAHLLRPAHLAQLSKILKDEEATANDKFVALELLKNANIASNFILPGCQDTGRSKFFSGVHPPIIFCFKELQSSPVSVVNTS